MARTTVGNVKEIIATSATDDQVKEMIKTANLMVNQHLLNQNLTANLLADIEKWLTAHLLAMTIDRQPSRIEIGGDTSEQYPKLGEGLKMTTYGQMVCSLDPTNRLATLGRRRSFITAVTSFDEDS